MMKPEIREILKTIRVSEDIIKLVEITESIELVANKDNILGIKVNKDIAYELYCLEFLAETHEQEITLLDVIYSSEYNNAFKYSYRFARSFEELAETETYRPKKTREVAYLVCYLLTKVNDYKYNKLKSTKDITEPIPFQIYTNLLNKEASTIELYFEKNGVKYAGTLNEIQIEQTMKGIQVTAYIDIISKGKKSYVKGWIGTQIYPKQFVSNLEDMGLHTMTDEIKAELTEAGKHYVEITKNPKYCEYHGEGYTPGWMGDTRHRIDSRIMIDVTSFHLLNPRIDNDWFKGCIFNGPIPVGEDVPENMLWMCSPVIYGFSFGNKLWCQMFAKDVSEIKFSENAFDELIIPEENKDVFIASLTHDMPSLDSISDKGAGKIFLLYGPPGVGKTLSAESVAEFLQKPLYYVSVGELGIRPEELERALDNVMKVANSWDAIILLDEVDVFAVKRDGASIERNAMTAIFLRMLERYSGVMFMTTNLLDNLDDAFISRSTAVIKYHDLTADDRAKIWNGLLDKVEKLDTVKISDSLRQHVSELATHNLNGRVIKNTVRLAYSLALSKNEDLTEHHIATALKLRQC